MRATLYLFALTYLISGAAQVPSSKTQSFELGPGDVLIDVKGLEKSQLDDETSTNSRSERIRPRMTAWAEIDERSNWRIRATISCARLLVGFRRRRGKAPGDEVLRARHCPAQCSRITRISLDVRHGATRPVGRRAPWSCRAHTEWDNWSWRGIPGQLGFRSPPSRDRARFATEARLVLAR